MADAHNDGALTLKLNNKELGGWTRVRVVRSVERVPSEFEIEMTDVVPAAINQVSARPGDKCQVMIGGDLVITGFVNLWAPIIDKEAHSIRVSGRSLSQDLVDCNAEWPHGTVSNVTALQLAQNLGGKYGIKVACAVSPGKVLPTFIVARTDTAFGIIERSCRWANLLIYDLPDGSMLMNQESQIKAAGAVKQGANVERASHVWADHETYQTYNVYNQSLQQFEDQGAAAGLVGKASDPNVKRNRQKFMVQEMDDPDQTIAQKRAEWEAARRMGRGHKLQVRVDSWRSGGKLWEPNTRVTVDLPSWKIIGTEYVLGEVTFLRDDTGTHADLVLMLPGSYKPAPILLQPVSPEYLIARQKGATDPPTTGGRR